MKQKLVVQGFPSIVTDIVKQNINNALVNDGATDIKIYDTSSTSGTMVSFIFNSDINYSNATADMFGISNGIVPIIVYLLIALAALVATYGITYNFSQFSDETAASVETGFSSAAIIAIVVVIGIAVFKMR